MELIEKSSQNLPASSLLEIAHNPDYKSSINKLVIGKPVTQADAPYGGYMTPQVLADSVQDAISKTAGDPLGQWKAGIMGWQVWLWMNVLIVTYLLSPSVSQCLRFSYLCRSFCPGSQAEVLIDDGQKE